MNLAKYLSVFNIGLQNTFVYRWNYFLRALFGLIPLAGTVFLWRAIFQEPGGRGFGGYDYGSMIYYYLLTILVSNLVTPTEDDWQIAADIREGQINSFLTKPLNYLGYRTGIFLASGISEIVRGLVRNELICPSRMSAAICQSSSVGVTRLETRIISK